MSTNNPLISVVIPTYNNADGLRTVLSQLANQTFPNNQYEIIPVDNNSSDKTPEVIQTFSRQYSNLIRATEENNKQGIDAARNQGINTANGDYIFITDSDCIPETNWLENGISALKAKNARYGGGRIELSFRNDPPNIWECLDSIRNLDQEQNIKNHGFVTGANMFVAKTVFDEVGLFDHTVDSGGDVIFASEIKNELGLEPIYVKDAIVKHPARSTASEFIKKTYRTSKGERQLIARGIKERFDGSYRSLLPRRRLPRIKGFILRFSKRLLVFFLVNLVAYLIYLHQCIPIKGHDYGNLESAGIPD